ncbi:MAG: nucleotidyltransferase domain-containing protein [Actinomycetota bacterium]|nr:nucleotidyltransferase domain-containing protein [Actinomycetota bacterium]
MANPMKSVIPSAQGEVLAVLARTTSSLTGRQIAGLTDGRVSQKRVSDILNMLTGAGIVVRQVAGSSYLHRLNREHLAADAIVQLASIRDRLTGRIADEVGAWRSPGEGVWLFGSVVRGDGGANSDVDVLVVRNDEVGADDALWLSQIDALAQAVAGWTGNDCRIVEFSAGEIARLVGDDDPLVRSIRSEGIRIAGRRSLLAGSHPDRSGT